MAQKENMAPKGANKRARPTNEDEAPDIASPKKQRVQEDAEETESQEEAPSTLRRAASTRVRKPTKKFDIENVLAAPEPRQRNKTPRQQSQQRDTPPVTVTGKKTRTQSNRETRQTPAASQLNTDIYEVPDSDGEMDALPVSRKRKSRAAPETSTEAASPAPVEEADQPPKKRRGRPPRSQASLNGSTQSAAASPAPAVNTAQSSKSRVSKNTTEIEETIKTLKASQTRGWTGQIDTSKLDFKNLPGGFLNPMIFGARRSENERPRRMDDAPNMPPAREWLEQKWKENAERDTAKKAAAESASPSTHEDTVEQAAPMSASPSTHRDTVNTTTSESASPSIHEDAINHATPNSASSSIHKDAVSPTTSESTSPSVHEDAVNPTASESASPSINEDAEDLTASAEADPELESGDGEDPQQEQDNAVGEVCNICSRPDSPPGNEILLCDDCGTGVHQKCGGVPVIPKGDWYCAECSQKRAVPDIPNFDHHLRAMQRVLLDRCNGVRNIKPINLDSAYEKTYQVVEQTIVAGEGNSMLMIGARGSGKSALMERVISDAAKEHKDQFHVVKLNGFLHENDKVALSAIWRQLGKDMGQEDAIIEKTNNHADTMASLLATLSHPTEITGEAQDGVTSKAVIFWIDEFDRLTTHSRQTLLYNLFDIAQSKKAPIAVIGLTTKIDVVEDLEKRVKSRFSHRIVYLGLPKSLPGYWDICRQGFRIDDEDMKSEGINQSVKGHSQFYKWWNGQIEALRKTKAFQNRLEYHFYTTKSVTSFLRDWVIPLQLLKPTLPTLKPPGPLHGLEYPHSKLAVLAALSDLDLSLLIAAAWLEISAHTELVNFSMTYHEYTQAMTRLRVQSASSGMYALGGGAKVWGRDVALIAWENLIGLGLLINPASRAKTGSTAAAAAVQNQGSLDGKMFKLDVALEEIPGAVKLNAVLARWCKGLT